MATTSIDSMCATFNTFIGDISEKFIKIKHSENNSNLFDKIINTGINTTDKAIMAYNIKAVLYNISTVVTIAGVAGIVFGAPLFLMTLGGFCGRVFIEHAMEKTVVGGASKLVNSIDDHIYTWLFKPLI